MYCYFSVINDISVPTSGKGNKYSKALEEVTMTFINTRQLRASVSWEADSFLLTINFTT